MTIGKELGVLLTESKIGEARVAPYYSTTVHQYTSTLHCINARASWSTVRASGMLPQSKRGQSLLRPPSSCPPCLFCTPSFRLGFFLTFQTQPPRWTPAARRKRVIGLCAKPHLLGTTSVRYVSWLPSAIARRRVAAVLLAAAAFLVVSSMNVDR